MAEQEWRKDAEAIFKEHWHRAQEQGVENGKVRAGLAALEEAGYLRAPTQD